jgi:hypothetical protein
VSAATSGPRRLLGASDSSAATSSAASFTTGEMASLRVIGRKMQKRWRPCTDPAGMAGPEHHHHHLQGLGGCSSASALNPRIIMLGLSDGQVVGNWARSGDQP